uniref:Uncharacterized protein n=1 Tax=Leersia perrieri TaxID=77586 RepID=A0A0D9WMP3_9ORYZ
MCLFQAGRRDASRVHRNCRCRCLQHGLGLLQCRSRRLGLISITFLDPKVGVLTIPVLLEPRAPGRVVDGARRRADRIGRVDAVVAHQEVPRERHLAHLVVVQPHEAVQVRAAPRAHSLGRQRRHVLGVAAVEQHHGRPVLARVGRLHGAVHLGRLRGPIVVVHAQHGVAWVGITGHEFGDVGDEEEVAVDEERPAAVAGEVRGEEAGEGEFGAFRGAALAPVQTRRPELLLDDRDHGERHGGATQQ